MAAQTATPVPAAVAPSNTSGIRRFLSKGARFSSTEGAAMRVLVLHGPNLNLLGVREPEIYGTQTLADLNREIVDAAAGFGIAATCEQYNGEGQIIEALHAARGVYDAIVINPGAYAHYSYAIADALRSIGVPAMEVHLTNVAARDEFRRVSVTAAACRGSISGLGSSSYVLALRSLAETAR
jgi:3-dehydroquinate dehydratase-2